MKRYKAAALLAVWMLGLSNANAMFALRRCDQLGDNLDPQTAKGRVAWARKCYPHEKSSLSGTPDYITIIRESGERASGYPIFGTLDAQGNITYVWAQAPSDVNAPCDQAAKYELLGACVAGCYAPDQVVEFDRGDLNIAVAEREQNQGRAPEGIVTLGPQTSLEKFELGVSKLHQVVTDVQPKWQDLVYIKLAGGSLKVTPNHPLITSEGRMVRAEDLKVGQELLTRDGKKDPIVEISTLPYYGRVYNVAVASENPMQQIVIGQGYLNGSIWYQNQGATELNRRILRHSSVLNGVLQ